jgi:outer membrane protein TolC
LRAEVAVANARPALIRARNGHRVAQDQLRATLGAPAIDAAVQTDLHVEGVLTVDRQDIDLLNAVTAARAHRPELLRQERFGAAADEAITSARSGYKPSVRAIAGYQWAKPSLGIGGRDHIDGWRAGIQADWAIFDGRATAGRIAQAESRAAQTRLTGEELRLAIEVEVRRAHSSLLESDELLVASERVIEQARESVRLAQARLQAGTATQLDLLEAQSALTLAQSNAAQAQHDYAVGLAALHRATGRPSSSTTM